MPNLLWTEFHFSRQHLHGLWASQNIWEINADPEGVSGTKDHTHNHLDDKALLNHQPGLRGTQTANRSFHSLQWYSLSEHQEAHAKLTDAHSLQWYSLSEHYKTHGTWTHCLSLPWYSLSEHHKTHGILSQTQREFPAMRITPKTTKMRRHSSTTSLAQEVHKQLILHFIPFTVTLSRACNTHWGHPPQDMLTSAVKPLWRGMIGALASLEYICRVHCGCQTLQLQGV